MDDAEYQLDEVIRALLYRDAMTTDSSYEAADIVLLERRKTLLATVSGLRAEVDRLRIPLQMISVLAIIPPFMTEQARQLMFVQDMAKQALDGTAKDMVPKWEAENASLRAEVEALRADAERYRWLRDTGDGNWRPMADRVPGGAPVIDANIDDAIAARAAQEKT